MVDRTEFSPGQMVSVRSDPSQKGAVVEMLPGQYETRFQVFVDGNVRPYYASQLQAEEQSDDNFQPLSCDQFHAYLTALQIRHPNPLPHREEGTGGQ